jgi:hypothetical protein
VLNNLFGTGAATNDSGQAAAITAPHQTPQSSVALFDAPSHLIPSVSKLYNSFMDSLLQKTSTNDIEHCPSNDKQRAENDKDTMVPDGPGSDSNLQACLQATREQLEEQILGMCAADGHWLRRLARHHGLANEHVLIGLDWIGLVWFGLVWFGWAV